jgi:hypothetical protein
MRKLLGFMWTTVFTLAVASATIWGALALLFRVPGHDVLGLIAACCFAVLGCLTILSRFWAGTLPSRVVFAMAFVGLLAWWSTLNPPTNGNWAPDVARQVTGVIDGDILTLTNVREFDWRSNEDVTENWTMRTYDLSQLQSLDMFLSYWAGPQMAHFILSFGFEGDTYLAWSVEVRREISGGYSPLRDAFKEHTLVIIASTERDVVGVRSNIRGEDVQLFRLTTTPDKARDLLEEYVRDANVLAERPYWYNSISANCTTVITRMLKAIGDGSALDWRILANGYLPELGYERGAFNTEYSIEQLRALGRVATRAQEEGLTEAFSVAIREGVPTAGYSQEPNQR